MKDVLVIDDNEHSRKLVKFALKSSGYHIHEASDGENALEILLNKTPDLLILDWFMPRLSGRLMIMLTDDILNQIEKTKKMANKRFEVIVYSSIKIGERKLPNSKHFKYLSYISKDWSMNRQIERIRQISTAKLGVAS